MPLQDAADRADRRNRRGVLGDQRPMNRRSPELTEVALDAQRVTESQHASFELPPGAMHVMRDGRAVRPQDAIQARLCRARHPALHGMETDSRSASGGSQREATADPGDDLAAPARVCIFLAMREYGATRSSSSRAGVWERAHALKNARALAPTRLSSDQPSGRSDPEAAALR